MKNLFLFSTLCLGAKLRLPGTNEIWVKIKYDPAEACIAAWNPELQTATWFGQTICILDADGKDMYVELVRETEVLDDNSLKDAAF